MNLSTGRQAAARTPLEFANLNGTNGSQEGVTFQRTGDVTRTYTTIDAYRGTTSATPTPTMHPTGRRRTPQAHIEMPSETTRRRTVSALRLEESRSAPHPHHGPIRPPAIKTVEGPGGTIEGATTSDGTSESNVYPPTDVPRHHTRIAISTRFCPHARFKNLLGGLPGHPHGDMHVRNDVCGPNVDACRLSPRWPSRRSA